MFVSIAFNVKKNSILFIYLSFSIDLYIYLYIYFSSNILSSLTFRFQKCVKSYNCFSIIFNSKIFRLELSEISVYKRSSFGYTLCRLNPAISNNHALRFPFLQQ